MMERQPRARRRSRRRRHRRSKAQRAQHKQVVTTSEEEVAEGMGSQGVRSGALEQAPRHPAVAAAAATTTSSDSSDSSDTPTSVLDSDSEDPVDNAGPAQEVLEDDAHDDDGDDDGDDDDDDEEDDDDDDDDEISQLSVSLNGSARLSMSAITGTIDGEIDMGEVEKQLAVRSGLSLRALLSLGGALIYNTQYEDAVTVLQEAADAVLCGHKRGQDSVGDLFYNLSIAYSALSEYERAIEASKHALRLYDTYRKHDRAVNALIVQASCHLELSRPGEVVQGCLDHLRRWEMAEVEDQPEDHALLALLYAKVGRAFFELQKFDIAADTLQSALRICPHTSGYRGTLLQNLGAALNATGSFEEAVTFHKQALKEFVQSPQAISEHLANIRDNLGFAEGMTGDLNAASMSLERAHVLWLEAGLPSMAVLSLERLGGVLEHFNLPQRALVHYQRAIGCAASNGLEEDRTRVEEKVQAIWDALTDAEHKRMYGNAAAIMAAEAEAAVAVTHTGTDTPAQAPTSHQQNQQQQQQQQGAFDRRAEQPAAMSSYGNTGSDGDEDDGVGVGGDGRGGGGGGDEDGGVGDRRQLASFGPSRSSGDTIMLGVPDDEEEDQDRYNGQGGDWIPFTDNGQWHRQQQHGRGVNEASYLAPTPAGFGHGDPSYAEIPTLSETQLEHVPPATPSVSRGALQQASVVAAPSTDRNGTTNTSRVANTGSTGRRSGRRREDVRGRGSARGSGRSRPHSKGEGPDASSRACTIM